MQRFSQNLLLCMQEIDLSFNDQIQNRFHQLRFGNGVRAEIADAAQLGAHSKGTHNGMGIYFIAFRAMLHHVLQRLQRTAHIVVAIGIARLDSQHIIQLLDLSRCHRNESMLVKAHLAAQSAGLSHGTYIGNQISASIQHFQCFQLRLKTHLGVVEILVQIDVRGRLEERIRIEVEYCVAVRPLTGNALSQPFCVSLFQSRHDLLPFCLVRRTRLRTISG